MHRLQLLREQLGRIRESHLRALGRLVAMTAFEYVVLQFRIHRIAAHATHVDKVRVTAVEETLLEELGIAVGDLTISFHLPESETTVFSTTLERLSGHQCDGSSRSAVDLVVDHMLQTLIKRRSEEDRDHHLSASEAIVHDL